MLIMGIELNILDWIQSIRTPIGDVVLSFVSGLGNSGIIWVLFTIILILIPKTRKSGTILVMAL